MRVMKWMVTIAVLLIAGSAFAQRGAGGGMGGGRGGGGGGGMQQGGGARQGGGLPNGGANRPRDGGANNPARRGDINPRGARGQLPPEVAALRDRIKFYTYEFEPTGEEVPYALFLPGRYNKKKPSPLVIALHGAGVGPESIAAGFANAADRAGYIIAAPMGYNQNGWYGLRGAADARTAEFSEQDVMNVLELVRAEYNVDPRRIYIAGHSMGGVGAIHIAAKHPDVFAAVGAMSPGFTGANIQLPGIGGFDAAPIVVLAGERDELIPIDMVREWVAGLEERKVPAKYYEYKGGNHAATLQQGAPKQVFDFFKKHARPEAEDAR